MNPGLREFAGSHNKNGHVTADKLCLKHLRHAGAYYVHFVHQYDRKTDTSPTYRSAASNQICPESIHSLP